MNRLSGTRGDVAADNALNWAQRFEAVTQVTLQAQLVHRGLRPLWANSAFVDLFHFSSIADVLSCGCLLGLFDPDTDYTKRAYGRRLLCRRDGARFPAEIYSRPVVWDGAEAAALCVRDATEEELARSAPESLEDWWVCAPGPLRRRPALRNRKRARAALVVHAWPEARRALAAELAALGLTPELAAGPEQALAALETRPFDLVLVSLPTGLSPDEFDLARRIRALPAPWAQAPIAALVPAITPQLRDALAAAGMDAWLTAPPSRARLAEIVRALTGSSAAGATDAGSVQPAELDEVQDEDEREKSRDRIDGHHVRVPQGMIGAGRLEPEML